MTASADPASVLACASRIVAKVGSSLVTNDGQGLDVNAVAQWARQIALLHKQGKQVVLVSSGAIAEGMARLGWARRPTAMHELQAAAAVGQMGLAQAYEVAFSEHGLRSAQILLTHEDLADRQRYLNARSTLFALLRLGVVPIVNENDTVATDEIAVGDNDTLGALVTNLIEADTLVILTDQRGLYEADPRKDPAARFVAHAQAGDPALESMAGGSGSGIGKGGMLTKILAARRAARKVRRADQFRRALDEHQRLALVEGVVAERDAIGAGIEEFVADRLGDAEAAGSVLAIDHDEIERPAAPQARQGLEEHGAAGPADNVTNEEQPHRVIRSRVDRDRDGNSASNPCHMNDLALCEHEIDGDIMRLVRHGRNLLHGKGDRDSDHGPVRP